jgi:hypothetical protein
MTNLAGRHSGQQPADGKEVSHFGRPLAKTFAVKPSGGVGRRKKSSAMDKRSSRASVKWSRRGKAIWSSLGRKLSPNKPLPARRPPSSPAQLFSGRRSLACSLTIPVWRWRCFWSASFPLPLSLPSSAPKRASPMAFGWAKGCSSAISPSLVREASSAMARSFSPRLHRAECGHWRILSHPSLCGLA